MSIKRTITALAVIAIAGATAAPGGALAEQTTLDEVNVAAGATQLAVTGSATFGTEDEVEVGFDGLGDSLVGNNLGLDFERFTIQRVNGTSGNLTFTIELDGLTGGGVPEAFQYNWDIAVDGGAGAGGNNWSIKSMRSGQASAPGDVDGWANLNTCVPGGAAGGFTCTSGANLPVAYDATAGEIRITIPLSGINADEGSTIEGWARNGEPIWVRTSAAGALTGGLNADAHTPDATYTVPGNTVRIGVAAPGTLPGLVNYTTVAEVNGGGFAAQLPKPGPGTYDVWVKACYGGSNCDAQATAITI